MNSQDKLKILFPNREDIFKMFHIDFETGTIYKKDFWDRGISKEIGRPTTDENYRRINVNCPHLTHIFKRGYVDVSAHRLIYYAHTGELPEKIDHKRKDVKFLNAISNLRASDSVHNRWNTQKINRKKIKSKKITRNSSEHRGIYFAYNYYWAKFNGKILNQNGFIIPILAVNFRNEHLKKEFIKMYGSLDNFPENALDIIDEQELFLAQIAQKAIEKTQEYQQKQKDIKFEMKKRAK
jgi:hypothetical protein